MSLPSLESADPHLRLHLLYLLLLLLLLLLVTAVWLVPCCTDACTRYSHSRLNLTSHLISRLITSADSPDLLMSLASSPRHQPRWCSAPPFPHATPLAVGHSTDSRALRLPALIVLLQLHWPLEREKD